MRPFFCPSWPHRAPQPASEKIITFREEYRQRPIISMLNNGPRKFHANKSANESP